MLREGLLIWESRALAGARAISPGKQNATLYSCDILIFNWLNSYPLTNMKYFIWFISSIDLYFGIHGLLNAMNILHNSKYSQSATKVFAALFLLMGIGGFYFSIFKPSLKLALSVALGPWLLALAFLLITMLTSDYK